MASQLINSVELVQPESGMEKPTIKNVERLKTEQAALLRLLMLLLSSSAVQEQRAHPAQRVEHHQPGALQPQGRDHGEQEGPGARGGAGESPTCCCVAICWIGWRGGGGRGFCKHAGLLPKPQLCLALARSLVPWWLSLSVRSSPGSDVGMQVDSLSTAVGGKQTNPDTVLISADAI